MGETRSIGAEHQSAGDAIQGLVERVTFHNEESGFAVVRLKVRGFRDLVTAIGSVASIHAGEWVTAEGTWVHDREHGRQFKSTRMSVAPPTSREGVEKYLASGMIRGIGPVYARKLVDKFGEGIFDVIETHSARLEEVDGIGPGRRKKIKEAWQEQRVVRDIMVFLHSQGVSTSRAVRIYKQYGEDAIEKVRQDPYRLARDIPGIGFQTADQIARRLGIPDDSVLRAAAGVSHVLWAGADEGHVGLPVELLLEESVELLKVAPSVVETGLARALALGEIERERTGNLELLYQPQLRAAEETVAVGLKRLVSGRAAWAGIDAAKAIPWAEAQLGLQLAVAQREAIRVLLGHRSIVITGGPGVGKTTLLRAILRILRAKKFHCLLCAPTGRAAKRMSEATGLPAKTIHRLLEPRPSASGFARNEGNPLEADLVVVDEISMVDVVLMSQLLRALPRGCGLLMVGDPDQLPSVGAGAVLNSVIESRVVPVVKLNEVFRQAADSAIVRAAHQVNVGSMPEPGDAEGPSDFYFIEREEPEAILRTLLDVVRSRVPKRFRVDPVRDIQVLSPMNRSLLGVVELNRQLQEALNPVRPGEPLLDRFGWQYRIRDKVIQNRNNYDKDTYNGDIGWIQSIDLEERLVKVRFDEHEAVYDFGEMDELDLAYAITIHKSQGSEFPVVVMPLATQHYLLLQRNLVYTGLTRGRKLVVIVGQKKALGMAVRNQSMRQRYTGLVQRLMAE